MDFRSVRGFSGIKEAQIDIEGMKVNVAIVYGLANVHKLLCEIPAIPAVEANDDFSLPSSDGRIMIRISFLPETWIGARDSVMPLLAKLESRYGALVKVEE